MATTRPFAYNTGASIPGTEQVGNLAVGDPTSGFDSTGLDWWMGPDEDLGYVIAHETPGGQPGANGNTAYLGFFRSIDLTEPSFISLSDIIGNQSFASGNDAKTWLNTNGYWTSWVNSGPTLLAALNASSLASYPGTGNSWFDTTAYANDGMLEDGSGAITFSTTVGGEFDLNGGSGTRISFADNSDTQLSTTTTKAYSVWFKADAVGFINFSKTLMCKQIGLGGSTTSDGFFVGINSSNQLIARVTSDNSAINRNIAGIGATVSIGTWYMATLVVKVSSDPDTFKLYLNTTEVGSTNGGGSFTPGDNRNLLLGNYDSGIQNAQGFDGMIGDFYINEGDFTSADVQSLFDNTKVRFGY